jgi:hypothetical protein
VCCVSEKNRNTEEKGESTSSLALSCRIWLLQGSERADARECFEEKMRILVGRCPLQAEWRREMIEMLFFLALLIANMSTLRKAV